MADASYSQTSFLGGEWSLAMQGRFDRPDYRTAMNVCLNGFPTEQGAWVTRGGTRHADLTRYGSQARLIAFDFNRAMPYTMEFSDSVLRFFNGATLVKTNDAVEVASISAANPAVVETASAHGFVSTSQVKFKDLGTNNPKLHNRAFYITVLTSTTFSLIDAISRENVDGATLGAFVSGTVERVLEILTPYAGQTWADVRAVQADIPKPLGSTVGAVLLHAAIPPNLLELTEEPSGDTFAEFELSVPQLVDGPYFDPVPGGTLATPSAKVGVIDITLSFNQWLSDKSYAIGDYVTDASVNYKSLTDANVNNTPASSASHWEAVSAFDALGPQGLQETDIGRAIRLYSEPDVWVTGATYAANDLVAFGAGLRNEGATYWRSLVGSNSGNVPGRDLTKWALVDPAAAARWTWGKIVALTTTIDRALSGSSQIGDLINGAGINAAFDGVFSKTLGGSATKLITGTNLSGAIIQTNFVGKNYSGATAQKIVRAVVHPASDVGFGTAEYQRVQNLETGEGIVTLFPLVVVTLRLFASHSNPGSPTDGTLLGTFGPFSNTTAPVTINSNDPDTEWEYVWVAITCDAHIETGLTALTYAMFLAISQVTYSGPPGTGVASGASVQLIGDDLLYTDPIRTWRLGVYSDTTGWPSCGCYHEGRLWLAGPVPNRIDSSKPNEPFNFAPTEPDGTVTAANGISYRFNSKTLNTINWMEPDDLGIICGTQGAEWLVQATTLNAPLTPTTIQAHAVTFNGCANIEPKRAGLTLAIVQRFQRKTLEYFADVIRGKFAAQNLTLFGAHLTSRVIEELAYTQEKTPVLWHRMADGSLVGLTYKRDSLVSSQPPNFMGMHRHILGSARTVESIVSSSAPGIGIDALTMVTNGAGADNVRHVEIMTPHFDENDDLENAFQLDDAIVPTAYDVDDDGVTFFGLWPHIGREVTVVAGGLDLGEHEVEADGTVTVEFGDGLGPTAPGLFDGSFVQDFAGEMPCLVGFAFTAQGQLVRPATPQESGARNGPALGKTRRSHKFAVLLGNAVNESVKFGGDLSGTLRPALLRQPDLTAYSIQTAFNGVHKETLENDYSMEGAVAWQVTRPYPLTICAVQGFIQTMDE